MRLNKHRALVIAIVNLFKQLIDNSKCSFNPDDPRNQRLLTFYFTMEDFLITNNPKEFPPAVECLSLMIK